MSSGAFLREVYQNLSDHTAEFEAMAGKTAGNIDAR